MTYFLDAVAMMLCNLEMSTQAMMAMVAEQTVERGARKQPPQQQRHGQQQQQQQQGTQQQILQQLRRTDREGEGGVQLQGSKSVLLGKRGFEGK